MPSVYISCLPALAMGATLAGFSLPGYIQQRIRWLHSSCTKSANGNNTSLVHASGLLSTYCCLLACLPAPRIISSSWSSAFLSLLGSRSLARHDITSLVFALWLTRGIVYLALGAFPIGEINFTRTNIISYYARSTHIMATESSQGISNQDLYNAYTNKKKKTGKKKRNFTSLIGVPYAHARHGTATCPIPAAQLTRVSSSLGVSRGSTSYRVKTLH